MLTRIKNFMAYAAAMPVALLAALPAGAQSVDNAADAFQKERKYSVDNLLPPPSFYYRAKEAMEYADRLSGSADVRAFVDATGSAVHIGGWYEYVTKQSKKPDGIAAKLRRWLQAQLGHNAGDVNRPRIDIDLLWTEVDDSEDYVSIISIKNRVNSHMRATPTVGSYFPAERVKSFTSAIGSYTDTSLSIADSRADQRVIEELEALQKGAKKIVEGYNVEANWISQFDPMFPKAGCCSNKSTCCKCACDEILRSAETSTDRTQQIIAANSSNKDCSNITASTDFSKALQIIDKSLKEHKLPIMVGVHHPTPIKDDDRKIIGWEETCSGNTPKETNHYVVIVGKQYDKTKKLHYYLFYEVGTEDAQMGKSSDNKLYIYSGLIKGLTKYKENIPSYYYILTEIRKNIGQIY